MVETDIEAEIMYKVVVQVSCMIRSIPLKHLVMSETTVRPTCTTVIKEHSTQPMTERDGKFWNRDAPLSHKSTPKI